MRRSLRGWFNEDRWPTLGHSDTRCQEHDSQILAHECEIHTFEVATIAITNLYKLV